MTKLNLAAKGNQLLWRTCS